ncbi:MAG: transporter substrate-binding domain-containing protein [Sterolibacteriaceae bacterium]|nr:transporter substrate-binding domain-containing protein [Candidatus Methylophosphatis haderslevensis]
MPNKFKLLCRGYAALALVAALLAANPGLAAETLKVCVDADNPPFSSESRGGIDVDIARALATGLQRELALQWVRVPERGGLGKALKQSIQAGQCDIFMGLPLEAEMTRELAERKLATSRTYMTVGYVSVSLRAGGSGSKIGAVTATPADLYLHRQHTADRQPYANNRDLIEALRAGKLKRALIWSPALAEHLAGGNDNVLQIDAAQPADPGLRFGLLAAVRSGGTVSLADIDRVLAELASAGKLAETAAAHALPAL